MQFAYKKEQDQYLCSLIWTFSIHRHTLQYGKCPKTSNTKESDKMTHANSVDPDQTAPEGAV